MKIIDEQSGTAAVAECLSSSYQKTINAASTLKPYILPLGKAGFTILLQASTMELSELNAGTMFSEALDCQPTDSKSECYAKITPDVQLTELITIGLNLSIVGIVMLYFLTYASLKKFKDTPYLGTTLNFTNDKIHFFLNTLNEASKETLKCFLFLFQMIVGFAGYISYITNVGNPEQQGNISNNLFYLLTGICITVSLFSSHTLRQSLHQSLLSNNLIAPTIKDAIQNKEQRAITISNAGANSFFFAAGPAAEINYNVTTAQKFIAIQTNNGVWLNSLPANTVRWSATGVAFTAAIIFKMCEYITGSNTKSQTLATWSSRIVGACSLLSVLYSLFNVFTALTYLTILSLSASVTARTAEYMTLYFMKNQVANTEPVQPINTASDDSEEKQLLTALV